jgi:hypothetical protein
MTRAVGQKRQKRDWQLAALEQSALPRPWTETAPAAAAARVAAPVVMTMVM